MSNTLNIDIGSIGLGRVDLKIGESGHAACIFSNKDLVSVKMNGNHTVPRLEGFIESEVQRVLNQRVKQAVDMEIQRIAEDPNDEMFKYIVNQRLEECIERIANDPKWRIQTYR